MQWIAYDCGLCTCIPNVLQLFRFTCYRESIIFSTFIESLGEITTSCFCWSIAALPILTLFQSIHWQIHAEFPRNTNPSYCWYKLSNTSSIRYNKSNSTLQNKVHPQPNTRAFYHTTKHHFCKHSKYGVKFSNSICIWNRILLLKAMSHSKVSYVVY